PFQVFFIRNVKLLYGRGSNEEKLAAIEEYVKNPNPDALLIFLADHISIPADARRMELTDRDRYERIRETLGAFCGIVELGRVEGAMPSSGEGDDAAIGHLYMLATIFRQMLLISERNVRDQRALWQALWQGVRVPPFAAEDIIKQARRYQSRRELTQALRTIAR